MSSATTGGPLSKFSITREAPTSGDVRQLLDEHLALVRRYSPPGQVYALDAAELDTSDVSFFTLREENELLGIGALKQVELFHVEIKSMYTAKAARGRGVARAVLEHLLDVARCQGYVRVSLQTGSMAAFAPARALYQSIGFRQCEPFGEHRRNPGTTCMTLELE